MSRRMDHSYRIVSPVEWDRVRYEIGEVVAMPKAIARPLVEAGAVRRVDRDTRISREGEGGGDPPRREPATGGAGTGTGEPHRRGVDPPSAPAAGGGEPPSPPHAPTLENAAGAASAPPAAAGGVVGSAELGDEPDEPLHRAGIRAEVEARHAAIVAAARGLDPEDSSLWTGRGKSRHPRVDALEAVLEYDVTAAERDAAWATVRDGG